MSAQIVKTKDGSSTLIHDEYGANYHSTHGAIEESRVVFIQNGLEYKLEEGCSELAILEIGFGTGLNFLMTMDAILDKKIKTQYIGLELYPVKLETVQTLDYPSFIKNEDSCRTPFEEVHQRREGKLVFSRSKVDYHIIHVDFFDYEYPLEVFDIIYYDAFGPGVQENLWTEQMAQKMYSTLRWGGVLVTYCVQGKWKRALKNAGFSLKKLPGPSGKREVLRALKDSLSS